MGGGDKERGKTETTGSEEEGRLRGADRKKCQRKAKSGRDRERCGVGMGGLWKQTVRQKREGEKPLI